MDKMTHIPSVTKQVNLVHLDCEKAIFISTNGLPSPPIF